MDEPRRLTVQEVDLLGRSLAGSGQLSRQQADRLVAGARRLLEERQRVVEVLDRLAEPWHDVRVVLNELHAALRDPG